MEDLHWQASRHSYYLHGTGRWTPRRLELLNPHAISKYRIRTRLRGVSRPERGGAPLTWPTDAEQRIAEADPGTDPTAGLDEAGANGTLRGRCGRAENKAHVGKRHDVGLKRSFPSGEDEELRRPRGELPRGNRMECARCWIRRLGASIEGADRTVRFAERFREQTDRNVQPRGHTL